MKIFNNFRDWVNLKLVDSAVGRGLNWLQQRYPDQYLFILSICTATAALSANALASLEMICSNFLWCWDTPEAIIYSIIFYASLAVGFLSGEKKASEVLKEIEERNKKNNSDKASR